MERIAIESREPAPGVRRGRRATAVATAVILTAIMAVAVPELSSARPAAVRDATSSLPTIGAHKGKPFVPILGNWDGTVDGFAASFQLRYDKTLPQRAGTPQYGLMHVVLLRPNACPRSSSRYAEQLVDGQTASEIGPWGSLRLSRFALTGGFSGRRSAELSARYKLASCSGALTWNMHPANRPQVNDGTWNLQFRNGQSGKFTVLGGGRLATSITLPSALTACNGLQGAVDLFIVANGSAKLSQSDLRMTVQFSRRTASGQLNAGGRGCEGGPIRFTASQR
jgi:hypothetical protein